MIDADIASIKTRAENLIELTRRAVDLIEQASGETPCTKSADEGWVDTVGQNTRSYLTSLVQAVQGRNPAQLKVAASNLVRLPSSADDYGSYAWFSKSSELSLLFGHIGDLAASVSTSVHIYDQANLEQVREALA